MRPAQASRAICLLSIHKNSLGAFLCLLSGFPDLITVVLLSRRPGMRQIASPSRQPSHTQPSHPSPHMGGYLKTSFLLECQKTDTKNKSKCPTYTGQLKPRSPLERQFRFFFV